MKEAAVNPAWKDVPIPQSMRTLEKDRRGYPIPFIAMRDKTGRAHFTVNDGQRVLDALRKGLCGICGKRLYQDVCLVGGLRCFTSPNGAFLDPPVHRECATYALRVCPFLAAPSYSKRIDDRTIKQQNMPEGMAIVAEQSMAPEQPPLFGLGLAAGITVHAIGAGQYVVTADWWANVEVWRHGHALERPNEILPLDFAKQQLAEFPEYAGTGQ